MYQTFGIRNSVERFFGYLKQRTRRFYNNINTWSIKSIEDYATAIAMIRNLTTLTKTQGGVLPGWQDQQDEESLYPVYKRSIKYVVRVGVTALNANTTTQ